jgi:hypothetical protein
MNLAEWAFHHPKRVVILILFLKQDYPGYKGRINIFSYPVGYDKLQALEKNLMDFNF